MLFRSPVVGLLWSVGFYLWLALFVIFNCFVQKRLLSALCFVPNLAIIATLLIATPVAADIRYAYSLVLSMPVLIMIGVHLQHEK